MPGSGRARVASHPLAIVRSVLLVGLTGGIGSGKTTVSAALGRCGAVVLDADRIVHDLQQPGQAVLQEMVDHFGPSILRPDGTLDRAAVAEIVFNDREQLDALGRIVHPRVQEELLRRVGEQTHTDNVVVLDVPLLAESGWEGIVGTIVVDLDAETAVARLIEHRQFTEADARARIANQASREERLAKATWVIDNSGSIRGLEEKVSRLWAELCDLRDNGTS